MPGIGVILNPRAGSNRKRPERLRQFTEAVGDDGLVCATESLAEMDEVAHDLRARAIDILAVCGGDGSYFRTLSAVVRAYGGEPLPRFLPLRAGSMNTIARSLLWRHGTPERVLERTVADYRAGRPCETTERHLLGVNGHHFGFMVGAAAVVNFLREYYGGPGRGRWTAAKLVGRVAASAVAGTALARTVFQRTEADIDCDGERVPHRRFTVIYASSIRDIGLGFKATYLATRKPGFFHLLAGPVRARQVIGGLRRLRHGWPLEVDDLYDNLAAHVHIDFARPTEYMIDGDVLGAVSQLDIVSGPRLSIIYK
ncbi:MAG: diacylglycerol kinase family protein [Candidatus Binatia bacterium]